MGPLRSRPRAHDVGRPTARGGLHCMKKTEVPVELAALALSARGVGALRAVSPQSHGLA